MEEVQEVFCFVGVTLNMALWRAWPGSCRFQYATGEQRVC